MSTQQQRSPATTHWRQVHRRLNPHLLYAEDLTSKGLREIDLEIVDSGVDQVEQMDGKAKRKKPMPWIAFAGAKKRLALNATNCKTLTTLCGTGIIEQWRGWVRLVVVETEYTDQSTGKREKTDALRIAPQRPQRASSGSKSDSTKPDANPDPAPPPEEPRGWNGELTEDEQREIAEQEAKNNG